MDARNTPASETPAGCQAPPYRSSPSAQAADGDNSYAILAQVAPALKVRDFMTGLAHCATGGYERQSPSAKAADDECRVPSTPLIASDPNQDDRVAPCAPISTGPISAVSSVKGTPGTREPPAQRDTRRYRPHRGTQERAGSTRTTRRKSGYTDSELTQRQSSRR